MIRSLHPRRPRRVAKKAPSGLGRARTPTNKDTGAKEKVQARKVEKQDAKRPKRERAYEVDKDPALPVTPAFPNWGNGDATEELPTVPPSKTARERLDEEKLAAFQFDRQTIEGRWIERDKVEGKFTTIMSDLVKGYEVTTSDICNILPDEYHKEVRRIMKDSLAQFRTRWIEKIGNHA